MGSSPTRSIIGTVIACGLRRPLLRTACEGLGRLGSDKGGLECLSRVGGFRSILLEMCFFRFEWTSRQHTFRAMFFVRLDVLGYLFRLRFVFLSFENLYFLFDMEKCIFSIELGLFSFGAQPKCGWNGIKTFSQCSGLFGKVGSVKNRFKWLGTLW